MWPFELELYLPFSYFSLITLHDICFTPTLHYWDYRGWEESYQQHNGCVDGREISWWKPTKPTTRLQCFLGLNNMLWLPCSALATIREIKDTLGQRHGGWLLRDEAKGQGFLLNQNYLQEEYFWWHLNLVFLKEWKYFIMYKHTWPCHGNGET